MRSALYSSIVITNAGTVLRAGLHLDWAAHRFAAKSAVPARANGPSRWSARNVAAMRDASRGWNMALLARVFLEGLLPLAVAYLVVSYLIDPRLMDTSELRANTILMNTSQIFRKVEPDEAFAVAVGSSAILMLTAMVGAALVAIPAGIAYGWSAGHPLKPVAWAFSTVAAALPTFFWAVAIELLMIFLWIRFGFRVVPIAGFGIDGHLVLPSLALGIRPAAYIFRLTALAVQDIRHTDYVRTALAKGLRDRHLLARHVFPNAAPNIIAAAVLGTRGALSSLLIVEFVFIWGGAGLIFVQALGQRDLELATQLALAFAAGSALLAVAAEFTRARVPATP